MDVPFGDVADLSRALAGRALSCREATRAHLDRIAQANGSLNAMISLDERGALEQADERDAEIASGIWRGPLHGVPFTVKDCFATVGMPTTCGVKEWAGFMGRKDAAVVRRLKQAGAVLLGKTNLPPYLSSFETDGPVIGRTANPYAPDRSAGGSSGGEAAIVSACGSAFGVGSDRGGSIRVPCHYCGVAGLKPTVGTVSALGHQLMPIGPLKTEPGPIARRVDDLLVILEVIADGHIRPEQASGPYVIAWYGSCDGSEPDGSILSALGDALAVLRAEGHRVVEVHPPGLEIAKELVVSLSSVHNEVFGRNVSPEFFEPSMEGELGDLAEVWLARAREWAHQSPLSGFEYFCHEMRLDILRARMEEFMESFDAIVCPVSGSTALPHGFTKDSRKGLLRANTALYSLSGNPAVCAPVRRDESGLPIGLQVVGRKWEDRKALRIAATLERTLGGWTRPPV